MTKKNDRRSQRTRQLLSEALVSLILEKGYTAMTVSDLIDRATWGAPRFMRTTAIRMTCSWVNWIVWWMY